jgi:hypothetical protein
MNVQQQQSMSMQYMHRGLLREMQCAFNNALYFSASDKCSNVGNSHQQQG